MSVVPIIVLVDADKFPILAALAAGSDLPRPGDYVTAHLDKILTGTRADVLRLHAQGLTDREISAALKLTRANVQQHRLGCGLFANKRKKA